MRVSVKLILAVLFRRTNFKKILSKQSLETLQEWQQDYADNDDFEKAAFLKYYITFKNNTRGY